MKHTKEEILNALKVISDICTESLNCDKCPFGTNDGRCIVQRKAPDEWAIKNEKDETWRAFDN